MTFFGEFCLRQGDGLDELVAKTHKALSDNGVKGEDWKTTHAKCMVGLLRHDVTERGGHFTWVLLQQVIHPMLTV